MFHKDAAREILLNAVVHKDYSSCNPVQVSIYEEHMYIWNDGEMPEKLSATEGLFQKHFSKPYNPKLANVFFKSGLIEACDAYLDLLNSNSLMQHERIMSEMLY